MVTTLHSAKEESPAVAQNSRSGSAVDDNAAYRARSVSSSNEGSGITLPYMLLSIGHKI